MMTSIESNSNINKENAECNEYIFKEHNINLVKDDAFLTAIIQQLPEHFDRKLIEKEDITLIKLPDAEINFDQICRTCFATTNVKDIFDVMHDGISMSTLLMQIASIYVQENDMMPKYICDACTSELISYYKFKKKCLQVQCTLEEIIKYSNTRQGACWTENTIHIPFLLHNLHLTESEDITKNGQEKLTQTENCELISKSNILNESHMKKEIEVTIHNTEVNYDTNLLSSDFENDYINEQNKCELPINCTKCNEVFETSEEFEKHLREVKHPRKRRKHACQICGKLYAHPQLKLHMRTHTKEKPFLCKICSKAFSLKSNLKRHFMLHTGERPHVCHICGKGFIQARSLSEHMCIHTGQKPLLCDVCGKGFTQAGSLIEHKCLYPGDTSFKCSYCGMIFSQTVAYQNHLKRHQITNGKFGQQLKETRCIICHKVFFARSTLKTHMLLHGEKTYLCNHCGKGFHSNAGLQSHLKVHTGDKPYSCSECGKSFSQMGSLKSHMLIHSGQRPYNCDICSKTFIQKSHLRYHIRTHSGEKPYKCVYCNKSFSLNGTLTVHIRTHTGETPYVCDVCGRGFYDSSSMKKHKRGHNDVKEFDKSVQFNFSAEMGK